MIPYGRQSISPEDVEAVRQVLLSDFLTQGPSVPQFEDALSKKVLVRHAVACNSATSALHLACMALGVHEGDFVWTCPNSFVASANCAQLCGAAVDFVDIDPHTLCMDTVALEKKLQDCQKNGKPLPKAVIPVHFAGLSCDMPTIHRLGQQYGFRIIEDASHAVGSKVSFPEQGSEHYVGSCEFSDICVFSFHPVKIITTGEGGACLTQSDELAHRLRALRSHGITRTESEMSEPSHGAWYYQMLALGPNYRLTDIQAALGISQLERLDAFVTKRQELAKDYQTLLASDQRLQNFDIQVQATPSYCQSSFHLFVVQVPQNQRKACFDALRANGFGVNVHYIPIHTQPYYQAQGFQWGDFPRSEAYYKRAISLPIYPNLPQTAPEQVVDTLARALA